MRVLHLIDSAGVYGAEKVLLSLARESAKSGHDVIVGTIVGPTDLGDPLGDAARAMNIAHVQFGMRDGVDIAGLRRVVQFVGERRVQVIHTHGYKANILIALVPRSGREWVQICTLHGWTSRSRMSRLALYEVAERLLLHRSDEIVAVSAEIAEKVRAPAIVGRLTTIPNGIELGDVVAAVDRGSAAERDRRPTELLAVGRLGAEKGMDLVIHAVHQLRARGDDICLSIAGAGPESDRLRSLVDELSLNGHVRFLGYRTDVGGLLEKADFFVLGSRTEGLPIVLLEAMAYGTPVICTPVGDIPKVLDDGRCGWLASEVSIDSVAEAIRTAVTAAPEEIVSRVVSALEQVRSHHSSSAMAERYLAIYSQALNRREARSADWPKDGC